MALMGSLGLVAVPGPEAAEVDLSGTAVTQRLQLALVDLRDGLIAYRRDHANFPGYLPGTPMRSLRGDITEKCFRDQLVGWSDDWGRTVPFYEARFPHGPYLVYGIPENPVNGLDTVHMLGDLEEFPAEPDGKTGWIYKPKTGEIRANSAGKVPRADIRYFDL
jgi:hypothetical protein